ncbi:bifunctional phosphoribosylaminoimidazolecarboxamide formyltransferase/IMP cyclohydrolase [Cerasibacillus terrae]|uniref:Bifunctional purine biosynthesis protein PurH n=1 Tax=Cerasibacillus terrae TaxID=2498845 RepID=A0A5C8NWQ7_9BACI|nr:bifunctional phosphoribosylaminoimidazolecarboxamide formyltransferase/IMP cyclohydrolase [Cerasibacillus terrae]TXL65667.1 bifunctional phosphoribosylaminoimidazolecarboxamide formyltransferase/IMP cyclohydrolase [Cerasibacillus terrae]
MKKRALISVSDKTGIVDFAKGLSQLNYEIISTGGTLKKLQDAGLPAIAVDQVTGFPEILDGRVKTLHPFIHGGLLAKRDLPEHQEQLKEHNIQPIDMVVVNLYPFKETLQREGATKEDMIENIDIGGPTMLRAAAKNYNDVAVIVDPTDYENVLAALQEENLDLSFRERLAAKVFRHTAQYDALIAQYFMKETNEVFPESYTVTFEKVQSLRYGENPHQEAAFYKDPITAPMSIASSKQLHGKALSYNNIQDANACIEMVAEYDKPAAVAVKHMNPCGIGVADTLEVAFQKAYDADPISIFGGIVALNQEVTAPVAEKLSEIFLEIVIAPHFTEEAFEILTKKKNIRLLELPMDENVSISNKLVSVNGGVLIQNRDLGAINDAELIVPTKRKPTEKELESLKFAWKAVKHVKSNAIVLAKDEQTIGVGAGQMNRVGAAKIAIEQAGEKTVGSVMASDAFFPMPDTVEAAAKAGIKAIIQPGGSKRDQDSIDMCDKYGVAMVFTGMRHFKH